MKPLQPYYSPSPFSKFRQHKPISEYDTNDGLYQFNPILNFVEPTTYQKHSSFLALLINLLSWLLLFPFQIKYNITESSYVMATSRPRKLLCFAFQLCSGIFSLLRLYTVLAMFVKVKMSVRLLFYVTSQLSSAFATIILFKIAWLDGHKIVDQCNLIAMFSTQTMTHKKIRFVRLLVCIINKNILVMRFITYS